MSTHRVVFCCSENSLQNTIKNAVFLYIFFGLLNILLTEQILCVLTKFLNHTLHFFLFNFVKVHFFELIFGQINRHKIRKTLCSLLAAPSKHAWKSEKK